jgi:arginine decarboxylase
LHILNNAVHHSQKHVIEKSEEVLTQIQEKKEQNTETQQAITKLDKEIREEDQKIQNDREKWNMIDSSFMTTLPDSWAINKKFIMLPLNRWSETYERVLLGGITCDSDDYYNSEQHANAIYLPAYDPEDPLYIGFFHTGAYQDSIGGYGGIQHCLTPGPKQILINKDENGEWYTKLFSKEQSYKSMFKILGY